MPDIIPDPPGRDIADGMAANEHRRDPLPPGSAPWRLLILDRGDDPKWMIVTVALPSDVRPAQLGAGRRYAHWADIPDWVRAQTGEPVELTPVELALAWHIRPAAASRPQPASSAARTIASHHHDTHETR